MTAGEWKFIALAVIYGAVITPAVIAVGQHFGAKHGERLRCWLDSGTELADDDPDSPSFVPVLRWWGEAS